MLEFKIASHIAAEKYSALRDFGAHYNTKVLSHDCDPLDVVVASW